MFCHRTRQLPANASSSLLQKVGTPTTTSAVWPCGDPRQGTPKVGGHWVSGWADGGRYLFNLVKRCNPSVRIFREKYVNVIAFDVRNPCCRQVIGNIGSDFVCRIQQTWLRSLREVTIMCSDQLVYAVPLKPGGRLNKKDGLTRYGDSHAKDKTS